MLLMSICPADGIRCLKLTDARVSWSSRRAEACLGAVLCAWVGLGDGQVIARLMRDDVALQGRRD